MINLYYDKIIDEQPVPNGTKDIIFSNDFYRVPLNNDNHGPIYQNANLYQALKATKSRFNIFSGKESAKNLFYPLEIKVENKTPIEDIIPSKTLSRIKKGRLKLLIWAPEVTHAYKLLWTLRERLDNSRIPRSQICIVLGDISRTYCKLFDNNNVFGFDWAQVISHINYSIYFGYTENYKWMKFNRRLDPSSKKIYSSDDWNPKYIFNALTGITRLHNTTLISEILYRGLDKHGKYSFNIQQYPLEHSHDDFRITDKNKGEIYKAQKKQIINSLNNSTVHLDITAKELLKNPFAIDEGLLRDSVLNIVSGAWSPMLDKHYLDETHIISTNIGLWRQIVLEHPFMFLGNVNTMAYINNEGYFSYLELISQHYDNITSTTHKVHEICNIIENLANLSKSELEEKMHSSIPFIKRNKERFFAKKHKFKFEKLFNEMKYE